MYISREKGLAEATLINFHYCSFGIIFPQWHIKKGSFFSLLYYVFFAVQSESEIRFLRSNL